MNYEACPETGYRENYDEREEAFCMCEEDKICESCRAEIDRKARRRMDVTRAARPQTLVMTASSWSEYRAFLDTLTADDLRQARDMAIAESVTRRAA